MEKILNTPIPFKFGEHELKISGYSLCDLSDMRQWIKGQKIKLLQSIGGDEKLLLMRETLTTPITDEEYVATMNSHDGIAYLFWCMAKTHSNVTLDEIRAGITKENLSEVMEIMATINKVENSGGSGKK